MKRTLIRMVLWYTGAMAVLAMWAGAAGYVHPGRLWAALAHARGSYLVWFAALNGVMLMTMTARWWRILLAWGYRIAIGRLVGYRVAAGAVSYITPGTQFGGEPLQAFLLVRREHIPVDIAAAAVFLERAMELAVNLLLVGGGALWLIWRASREGGSAFVESYFPKTMAWWLILGIVVVAGVVAARKILWNKRRSELSRKRQRWPSMERCFRRVRQTRLAVVRVFEQIRGRVGDIFRNDPWALVSALGLGLVNWVFVFGEFRILYGCVGEWLTIPQVFVVLIAARLGFWAPVPGGMGALEAGQLMAAEIAGFPPEAAVGACLLIRLRDVMVCSAGVFLAGRYVTQSIEGSRNGYAETEL